MIEKVTQQPGSWRGNIPVTSLYTAGIAGEKFLRELQNKGRITGARCAACDLLYVPARMFCERCFARVDGAVEEVSSAGTVHTWTVCRMDLDGKPLSDPVPVALVVFAGAHGGILHHLLDVSPEEIAVGMPVEAVFVDKKKRTGSILDIAGFRPVKKA